MLIIAFYETISILSFGSPVLAGAGSVITRADIIKTSLMQDVVIPRRTGMTNIAKSDL
jgi:hypothetical protein